MSCVQDDGGGRRAKDKYNPMCERGHVGYYDNNNNGKVYSDSIGVRRGAMSSPGYAYDVPLGVQGCRRTKWVCALRADADI